MDKSKKNIIKFIKNITIILFISCILSIIFINYTEEKNYKIVSGITNLIFYSKYNEINIDKNGIPVNQYRILKGRNYYNPVYVSVYGLYYYDQFKGINENEYFTKYYKIYLPKKLKKSDYEKYFYNTANWLINNGIKIKYLEKDCHIFIYQFEWPPYNLKPGWKSAMAQALAAQVFLRAWKETNDSLYFDYMMKCINCLLIPVNEGGVTYFENEKQNWYEEYADNNAIKSYVLNGMEHVLIALYEISNEINNKEVKDLLEKGNNSLRNKIQLYTNKYINWTNYDLIGTTSNIKYHNININLTEKLYKMSQIKEYQIFKNWKKLKSFYFIREFIKQKPNKLDILALAFNTIVIFLILNILIHIHKIIFK